MIAASAPALHRHASVQTPSRTACRALVLIAACAAAQTAASADAVWQVPGGNADRGARWIQDIGCARCHTIPGIKNANGNVGPPLIGIGSRTFIAGVLENKPGNLIRWIRDPQAVVPGNAMPYMGISEAQARDIAAYLYTLR